MTETRYILRTCCPSGESHGGFVWPLTIGAVVSAPDWNNLPVCGGGLHGLLGGVGDGDLLNWDTDAVWVVAEVPADAGVVDLDGKVKVEKCVVAHVGDMASCAAFLVDRGCDGPIVGRTATAENEGTATAGDGGTATAGDEGTATAGDGGTATAGYKGTATAGDEGTATAGDEGTAMAGYGGTATAGDKGVIIVSYYKDGEYLRKVGQIGEGGLKAEVAYRVDPETCEFVEGTCLAMEDSP